MEAFTIIALGLSLYALYEIHQIKENMKENNDEKQKAMKIKEESIHQQLLSLMNQRCEIVLNKPMMFIDIAYSYAGEIIDIDDDWVVMTSLKGKKQIEKIIKISFIQHVKQLKD